MTTAARPIQLSRIDLSIKNGESQYCSQDPLAFPIYQFLLTFVQCTSAPGHAYAKQPGINNKKNYKVARVLFRAVQTDAS